MGQVAAIASGIQAVAGLAQAGAQAKAAMQAAQMQAQQIAYQSAVEQQNLMFQANQQRQQALGYQLDAMQAEQSAKDEEIASAQEETARLKELRETLSTMDAIRANRGLRTSPTARAISKDIRATAENDIRTNTLNRIGKAKALRIQASYAGSLSDFSLQNEQFYRDQASLSNTMAKESIRSTLSAGKKSAKQSLVNGYINAGPSLFSMSSSFYGGPKTTKLSSGETIKWNTNRYGVSY